MTVFGVVGHPRLGARRGASMLGWPGRPPDGARTQRKAEWIVAYACLFSRAETGYLLIIHCAAAFKEEYC
jgi:hypothetical protein